MKVSKTFIFRMMFIISIIFFIIFQIIIYKFQAELESNTEIGVEIFNLKSQEENNKINEKTEATNSVWQIQIPSIELIADIRDGTDKETLNKYVGHFIETPLENGNIGLAAHNRGYDFNYFSRLKEVIEGDEIIYKYKEIERVYEVVKNKIIKDTDVKVLDNTE